MNYQLSDIEMPFKHKLIKEFQRYYRSKSHQPQEDPQINNQELIQATQKSKHKKRIITKNFSFFQLVLAQELRQNPHVINFFNILGINEQAIRDPHFDESVFTTIYYVKNVKKVEIKPNIVVLHLGNLPLECPPIEYITQRFKSFGDKRFYSLAVLLQQVASRLQRINQIEINPKVDENSQFVEKYIEAMGNRMFYCRTSSTRAIYSKSILEALQYNPEDFALHCTRYKACDTEFISAEPYFDIATKIMQNIRNLLDLIKDDISLQSFLDSSLFRFKGFMFTKNKKKLFCKLKIGMPNPNIHLFEIQQVVTRSDTSLEEENAYLKSKRQKIQRCKQERMRNEINKIRKVVTLPKNFLPQNEHLVTKCFFQKPQVEKASIQATNQ